MSGPANSYAEITREIDASISRHIEVEPEVAAYMLARSALLQIRAMRGSSAAAQMAYRLADEFASEVQSP